jgi:hypothetical protein
MAISTPSFSAFLSKCLSSTSGTNCQYKLTKRTSQNIHTHNYQYALQPPPHGDASARSRSRDRRDHGTRLTQRLLQRGAPTHFYSVSRSSASASPSSSSLPKMSHPELSSMLLARPCPTSTPKGILVHVTMVAMSTLTRLRQHARTELSRLSV